MKKNHTPQPGLNFKELEKQRNIWVRGTQNAQDYLDYLYPREVREMIKIINLRNENLTGALDLTDFTQLERFSLDSIKNGSLNISNNPKLADLKIIGSSFTEDRIEGLKETSLVRLRLGAYKGREFTPEKIWNILVQQQQAIFPEIELINIEDLNELVSQIPATDAEYEEKMAFWKKFWFRQSNKYYKESFTMNYLYHYYTLKKLVGHVFARCLIVRQLLHTKVEPLWDEIMWTQWANGNTTRRPPLFF